MENIQKITKDDKNYPKLLKEIKNPPEVIYYKGKFLSHESCFAIVGTRRCSSYGKRIALEFSQNLSLAGFTIVSGLAPGIDTFAHKAVIEQRKRTIAVLGTGLDEKSIYPKENIGLARKIIELGGCLISEYPPGTKGSRFTFPKRNRIISGLCTGVLIVEAKRKSGALITANYAFSQERKVFAVPGSIFNKNSEGCHLLIKQGAKIASGPEDILKELNISFEKIPEQKEKIIGDNFEENLILQTLKEKTLHIDKIIEETKLKPARVASTLTILEMKNKIRNLGNNIYSLK